MFILLPKDPKTPALRQEEKTMLYEVLFLGAAFVPSLAVPEQPWQLPDCPEQPGPSREELMSSQWEPALPATGWCLFVGDSREWVASARAGSRGHSALRSTRKSNLRPRFQVLNLAS